MTNKGATKILPGKKYWNVDIDELKFGVAKMLSPSVGQGKEELKNL